MTWGADGWLRTTTGEGIPIVEVPAPRGLTPQPHPPAPVREEFDDDTLPIAFQWLRSPWPDELFSLPRAAGTPASLRPRDDRQPLQAGARRAPATVALLQRVDDRRVRAASTSSRWPASSATTTAPSSTTSTSRRDDDAGKHVRVMSALPDQVTVGRVHAADRRLPTACRSSCASKWTTSGCISRIASNGGSVAVAAAAVRRQHPLGRGQRAGAAELHRARSSAWRVRTRGRGDAALTSTGSSTASGSTSAMCRRLDIS